LAASIEPFGHSLHHRKAKVVNAPGISADPIVIVMPSQFGRQQRPPVLNTYSIADLSEPVIHFRAGFAELLAGGFSSRQEVAFAA